MEFATTTTASVTISDASLTHVSTSQEPELIQAGEAAAATAPVGQAVPFTFNQHSWSAYRSATDRLVILLLQAAPYALEQGTPVTFTGGGPRRTGVTTGSINPTHVEVLTNGSLSWWNRTYITAGPRPVAVPVPEDYEEPAF